MSLIVKTATKLVRTFVLVFGLYLAFYGHLSPGGGFAGGVVCAGLYIMLVLAFGREAPGSALRDSWLGKLDSLALLVFLLIGLLGIRYAGAFLANFIQQARPGRPYDLVSAGTIPLVNLSIWLKVSASLALAFVALVAMGKRPGTGTREE
jgi:multicomponent Na+:H+ antiporter subunit B